MTQQNAKEFKITFWGTRGTLATPEKDCCKAGGNTVCVEVECGDRSIICDAGTGLRLLGSKIIEEGKYTELSVLLSHAHYDHVEGIPFFAPLFSDDYSVDIWCGHLDGSTGTRETVSGFMKRPYFPVGPEVFNAKVNYHLVDDNETIKISDEIIIDTLPLNHPGGASAYKIKYEGKSFAYVTDTEHTPGETNESIVDFIKDVDVFVYDASLTDEELPNFAGFGHSTWQEGMRLAKLANAKRYFAFHHLPFRCDNDLDQIHNAINKEMPGSGIARERVSLIL